MKLLIKTIFKNGNLIKNTEVYNDGTVIFKNIANNSVTTSSCKINVLNDILLYMENSIDKGFEHNKYDEFCTVEFDNKSYNSCKLLSDIDIMIRNNMSLNSISANNEKIRKNAFENKQKKENNENRKKAAISILDNMQKDKIELNLEGLTIKNNIQQKEAIEFEMVRKDSYELGETRFFSDVIDIADDVEYPEELEFVGQIKMSDFSKYDNNGLLPKKGYLYFFQGPSECEGKYYDFGKVVYSENDKLVRKKVLIYNEDNVLNYGIKDIKLKSDKISDRYDEKREYDPFYGEDENKLLGLYTDCQLEDYDILKVIDNYVVLLQLGSDIYGEGITTYLIKEEDLKNHNFSNVIFKYSQS